MMKTTKNSRKLLVSFLVFALIIASFSNMNVNTAKAAVTETGIAYDGNGEITKTLLNGKNAKVTLDGSIINITVDGEKYGYYNTICVGTCVISDDDLLHIFWHTGEYYVYDLYESGMYILAGYSKVRGASISYYQVTDVNDVNIVKGTSAPNAAFHSCIIDKKYFYQYGQTGKKFLMTRKEFEEIVYGKEDPTATPTVTPTVTPTATPDPTPTATPTVTPTATPIETPEVTPTATPGCDCKNGGTCNCPDGKCPCDNCPCKDKPCKPTATPTTTPNGGCKGNCGCGCGSNCDGNCCNGNCKCLNGGNNNAGNGGVAGDNVNNSGIDVSGDGNVINVNQSIVNTTVNGNDNTIGTGVNAPVPVTKKATKTTTKVKAKTYYTAIKSGNRMKLYKVTQKVVNGKIKTTRKWLSICLFDRKKGRMDWNSYRIKGVKKAQYSAKKHYIVIITKGGVVKACPSGKGTKKVKVIGKGAKAFKCNNRGLATSYVKKNGKIVKLAY